MTDPNTVLQRTLFCYGLVDILLSENFQLLIVVIVFALAIVAATIRLVNLWLNGRMAAAMALI